MSRFMATSGRRLLRPDPGHLRIRVRPQPVPGITDTGFVDRTLVELKESVEADERALISPTVNTATSSLVGQMNGVMAAKLQELWELASAIYDAAFTDNATGYPLTLRAALTGTTREAATATRVVAQCSRRGHVRDQER